MATINEYLNATEIIPNSICIINSNMNKIFSGTIEQLLTSEFRNKEVSHCNIEYFGAHGQIKVLIFHCK